MAQQTPVSAVVRVTHGQTEGRLLDLSGDGALVEVHGGPHLRLGERLALELEFGRYGRKTVVDAQLMHQRISPESRRYGLLFTDPDEVEEQVHHLRHLFNRRAVPRAVPEFRVDVFLHGDAGPLSGKLDDIAIGGAGVRVDRDADLEGVSSVRFSALLPGAGDVTRLEGRLRHTTVVPAGLRVGLEWAADRTDPRMQTVSTFCDVLRTMG